ncbi:MAG: mannosyl-3-phosphoglycerate phosphatase [Sulfurospirillum sp.]|nr:MAG: mannosyl-3-phosphoglycerate phosphatase [Sulfurospirillum sp.]
MNFIIFTDLDGTLLNHDDYSFSDALPLIEKIKARNIPLIFTTSKTKKECEILQNKMDIDMPFIVENGAAVYGMGDVDILGVRVGLIREFLEPHKDRYHIRAFYDMSVEEIMKQTGFDKENATLAKDREFSQPFLIEDESELEEFRLLAKKSGFKILKGGRFYHLVSQDQDKGRAVLRVLNKIGKGKKSIALGDNYNDLDMLKVVDIPILVPYKKDSFIDAKLPNMIKAPYTGAKGWAKALGEIIG